MLRVAFVGPLAASFAGAVQKELVIPCDILLTDERKVASELSNIDVLVSLVFTEAMGIAAKKLRLVQVPGAGLDQIQQAALPPETLLANVYGHDAGIAEFVFGAMLNLSRDISRLDAALKKGRWESQWALGTPPPVWPELTGKTLCILGYGHIGRAVARRAQAFDLNVTAIRRNATADQYATVRTPDAIDQLLAEADFLAITITLDPSTRGMIGHRELALMKPTAYLINVARGDVVDEEALYQALLHRRIAGAALDVWYRYPTESGPTFPSRFPFHSLPNVLMTPHISGWTDGMMRERAKIIAENIKRAAEGSPPVNLIARM